jgi:hypothetical protein
MTYKKYVDATRFGRLMASGQLIVIKTFCRKLLLARSRQVCGLELVRVA